MGPSLFDGQLLATVSSYYGSENHEQNSVLSPTVMGHITSQSLPEQLVSECLQLTHGNDTSGPPKKSINTLILVPE